MRRVIRLGNSTNCGSNIVSATKRYTADCKTSTQQADQNTAPIKSRSKSMLAEDDLDWNATGLSTALDGSKGSCGAILLSAAQCVN